MRDHRFENMRARFWRAEAQRVDGARPRRLRPGPVLAVCLVLFLLFLGAPRLAAAPARQETPPPPAPADRAAAWRAWQALPPEQRQKVDPRILEELRGTLLPAHLAGRTPSSRAQTEGEPAPRTHTRFLVHLTQQADLSPVTRRKDLDGNARRAAVVDILRRTADQSQAPLRAFLQSQQSLGRVTGYQPFFIINAIAVEGDLQTLTALAQRRDVARIAANYPLIPVEGGGSRGQRRAADASRQAEATDLYYWNLSRVNANLAHNALNVRGAGAVVASFDTGVYYRHPALVKQYRGNLGNGFDHHYNWFEPDPVLRASGDYGPSLSREPYDCDLWSTHGTHTTGAMVGGETPGGVQIGMAPGARWIAAPGICSDTMAGGISDDIGGLKLFQWFMCPTDLSGDLSTADCGKAPDVINNSWGSANPVDRTFGPVLAALRAAGVAPVFAAGNPEAGPGSIGAPANNPEAIAVSATDRNDEIPDFSARGPSLIPGEQKPEFSAPGVKIYSSVGSAQYDSYSGTSMAAPHVAGLVALMVSADLQDGVRDFNVDELERFMALAAEDLGAPGPDDLYGYGRIDAYAAVQLALAAGDMQGRIREAGSQQPVADARVLAVQRGDGERFQGRADAQGVYSLTVPGGVYDVTFSAWGYTDTVLVSHQVVSHALTLADVTLQPQPRAVLQGVVRDEAGPVAGAIIQVAEHPQAQAQSGPAGVYTFTLPLGEHRLLVRSPGHRLATETVFVPPAGKAMDFSLVSAPKILLVDTSALSGWFEGWPVYRFFTMALEQEGYLYHLWRIQSTAFQDVQPGVDGSPTHGLPSAATLGQYDVVIWIHSACGGFFSCGEVGSPYALGAEEALIAYLDGGGRLLLSGQDLVWSGQDTRLIQEYIQAQLVTDSAGGEGAQVFGADFLEGVRLPITNASLYGYANGMYDLSPDGVAPLSGGVANPVLRYADPETQGAAALATASCDANYRTLLLAVGYENLAPRGYQQQASWSAILDRSLQWLASSSLPTGFAAGVEMDWLEGGPGDVLRYPVVLRNWGETPLTLRLQVEAGAWPARLLEGQTPASTEIQLGPCATRRLTLALEIPGVASLAQEDAATLHVEWVGGSARQSLTVRGGVFPSWQVEPDLSALVVGSIIDPGVAQLPGQDGFYLIGGWGDFFGSDPARTDNLLYDACTRSWSIRAPLPQGRGNAVVAEVGGKILLAGGDGLAEGAYAIFDTLFLYDPGTDSWSTGAAMPQPRAAAAGVGWNGKLYVFGGSDGEESYDTVWVYDLAANVWSQRGPMPGGPRWGGSAVAVDGRIYVIGGAETGGRVDIYDPVADTWTEGAASPLDLYRPILALGPDGRIYVLGDRAFPEDSGLVQRYTPGADVWEELFRRPDGHNPFGAVGVFASGRLHLVAGEDATRLHDSLPGWLSFCNSSWQDPQTAVGPAGEIRYRIDLQGDPGPLPGARFTAPLPAGVTFVDFQENPVGAVYNQAGRQVEWSGELAPGVRQTVAYRVRLEPGLWSPGARITHTVHFANGKGTSFSKEAVSLVQAPDFSESAKTASTAMAGAGDRITYTIDLTGRTAVGDALTLQDVLPRGLVYAPGSLTATVGAAVFDPNAGAVHWSGQVQFQEPGFANVTDDYLLGDSRQAREMPLVSAQWEDVSATGSLLLQGKDELRCGLDIGFPFPFYGRVAEKFCVDMNGYITFQEPEFPLSLSWNTCPLGGDASDQPLAAVAALWDNLYVDGGVYFQALGTAPHRRAVIQWKDARKWDTYDETFGLARSDTDFEIVLHEDGRIYVNVLRAGDEQGRYSTTGIIDWEGTRSRTYACNTRGSLKDGMTVLFLPPGSAANRPSAQVRYAATVTDQLPPQTVLTNTAVVTGTQDVYILPATLLVNPVDLTPSAKVVSSSTARPGEILTYTVTVANTGLAPAEAATLQDPLPANLRYEEGSLRCSAGQCQASGNAITWTGTVSRTAAVTLTYRAVVTGVLSHGVHITNTATLQDGLGRTITRTAVVAVALSELSRSSIVFDPLPVAAGARVTLRVLLRNSGAETADASMSLTLPPTLALVSGSLRCGIGVCRNEGARILWSGTLPPRGLVPVQMEVDASPRLASGDRVAVEADVEDLRWGVAHRITGGFTAAWLTFMGRVSSGPPPPPHVFFPLVGK